MTKKNRVGEEHFNTLGCKMKIIEEINSHNCTVQFEDGFIKTKIKYSDIIKGSVKNPMYPSVYGVGYFGVGNFFTRKSHNKWNSMLTRCYSIYRLDTLETYKDCEVDKEWHNYQNFAQWYDNNYENHMDSTWHLDKDILVKGNKIYSPKTCCFVPQEINVCFTKRQSKRGNLPIGVLLHKKNNTYIASITKKSKRVYLGSFKSPEEAFQAYKIAKEAWIKELADKYRGQITEECYHALINYQVEITD